MARLLLLAGVLALIAPATAGAHHLPVSVDWKVQRSLPIADAAWPASPCAGRLVVHTGDDLDAALDARGANGQYPGGCVLDVRSTLDPVAFCVAVAHEAGHATGYGHDDDPQSLMFGGGAWRYDPCEALRGPIHMLAFERETLAKRSGHRWSCRGSSRLRKCVGRSRRFPGRVARAEFARAADGGVEAMFWY